MKMQVTYLSIILWWNHYDKWLYYYCISVMKMYANFIIYIQKSPHRKTHDNLWTHNSTTIIVGDTVTTTITTVTVTGQVVQTMWWYSEMARMATTIEFPQLWFCCHIVCSNSRWGASMRSHQEIYEKLTNNSKTLLWGQWTCQTV